MSGADEPALEFFIKKLGCCGAVEKGVLLQWISNASRKKRRVLRQQCGSLPKLEGFLATHEETFMVENGEVSLSSPELVMGRTLAVDYYWDILGRYEEPCYYLNLRGHVGQADRVIYLFLERFYHEEKFMDFLLAHPESFVVFDDDTVHRVQAMEEISADFYRNCLEKYGEGLYFTDFRGHYTHSNYVRQYVKRYYPGDDFWIFLQNNADEFYLEDGCVYLPG